MAARKALIVGILGIVPFQRHSIREVLGRVDNTTREVGRLKMSKSAIRSSKVFDFCFFKKKKTSGIYSCKTGRISLKLAVI